MGDPLGSYARVSSQKQNREGVVGVQSEQYCVTVESSPGCGGGPGRDVTMDAYKIKKLKIFYKNLMVTNLF